jgi:hypothetical protein
MPTFVLDGEDSYTRAEVFSQAHPQNLMRAQRRLDHERIRLFELQWDVYLIGYYQYQMALDLLCVDHQLRTHMLLLEWEGRLDEMKMLANRERRLIE